MDGNALPAGLGRRFAEFKASGISTEPLRLFWMKLRDNPNPNSISMLYNFLEHNGHPLTKDGNFIAYRKVMRNEAGNLVDRHTGKFDNNPGAIVSMPRAEVNTDPEHTCSSGLHVAAWGYLAHFPGDCTIEVEVDPRDVVAVPVDYQGTKMRVCKFRVLNLVNEPRLNEVVVSKKENKDGSVSVKGKKVKPEKVAKALKADLKGLKDRYSCKTKTSKKVSHIQFWTTNDSKSKGTLTVTTAKGKLRFYQVSTVQANKLLNAKNQDDFYKSEIVGNYESQYV